MKKIIISLFLLLNVGFVIGYTPPTDNLPPVAGPPEAVAGMLVQKKGAPPTPTCTNIYRSVTTQNNAVGTVNAQYYIGGQVQIGQTTHTLCRADVLMSLGGGSITGLTYTVEVWSTTPPNLSVQKGVSDPVTGDDTWDLTTVTFDFSTPVSVEAEDAIVITTNGLDGVNFANVHTQGGGDQDGGYINYNRWNGAGVRQTNVATLDWTAELFDQ